jgi:hypothetical protein
VPGPQPTGSASRVDQVAGDHPLPSAPIVTAASPVSTPARRLQRRVELRHRRDEVERRPDRPLGVVLVAVGVPHTAITASPMNFSTVPP